MDVGAWLRGLGLERYAQAFRDNDVDADVLPELTADDLTGLGITSVGHRRKLLAAIGALRLDAEPPGDRDAPARSREPERRQLTVMFVDLVGSTALAVALDPEEMREILRLYQDAVAGAVARFEGHIAKFLGDGVLCYFGWPRAHEDEPERAVRAGLAVVEAVGRLATTAGPLVARVGIATGLVVVGDLIGRGGAEQEAVVGETPNLAARLQHQARPSQVVVSERTRRLLGGLFEVEDLDPRPLRGFARPVRAFRILGPGRAEGRFEGLHAEALTPLVGRERELGSLLDRWALARGGEGQAVLLVGEPGIGKSRLVLALRERLRGEPCASLRYHCSPYHAGTALRPVIEHLERAAGFARDDDAAARAAKLGALLGTARDPEALPHVADLLSVPLDPGMPGPELSPRQRKARTFASLLARLEALAAVRPVLMVLEDAQWADPTTLELFGLAVERLRRLPVLLVVTSRPEFAPSWTGRAHAAPLTLPRLGRTQATEVVARVAGGKALPAAVLEEILARTDGVPLFVEELTKAVLESGPLREEEGRYVLEGPLPPLAIPDTLQGSLLARLDRLAPVREVAQIGAVIGREFSRDFLAAVAGAPESELERWLDQLVAAGLLARTTRLGRDAYAFTHVLVRDAAYASLLRSRRRQLHARVARALEEGVPGAVADEPELVARHYTEAGLAGPAIGHWRRAAERAARRYANAEAAGHLRRALRLLADLPAGPDRDGVELPLRLSLGVAVATGEGYAAPEASEAYARARELCRGVANTPALFPALLGLCLFYGIRSELSAARPLAAQCLAVAREARDDDLLLQACGAAGAVELYRGKLAAARTLLERGLTLYRPDHHRDHAARYGQDPLATLAFAVRTHALLGRPGLARQRAEALLALTRELGGQPNSVAAAHAHLAHFHLLLREAAAALQHAEAVVAVAVRHDLPLWQTLGRTYRGAAAVENALQGGACSRAGEAVAEGLEGLTIYRATGARVDVPTCLCWFASGQVRLGRTEEARRLLDEARRVVADTGETYFAPELHRLEGMALLDAARPDRAGAEARFGEAMATARAQGAGLWELRAATSLARLWIERGGRGRARELLASVYGRFREGFEAPDLREAGTLLQELASTPRAERRDRSATPS